MLGRVAFGKELVAVGLSAAAFAAGSGSLVAQEVAPAKIGVFNADRIMAESRAGQQALALFNQLRDQRLSDLQAQQEEMNNLRQQALGATPNTLEAAQLQRQLEDRMLQMDRLQEDVQTELANRQNELTGEITQQVGQIIETIGEEEGYSLLFNAIQSGLVFIDPTMDITPEIIRRLDLLNPGADP